MSAMQGFESQRLAMSGTWRIFSPELWTGSAAISYTAERALYRITGPGAIEIIFQLSITGSGTLQRIRNIPYFTATGDTSAVQHNVGHIFWHNSGTGADTYNLMLDGSDLRMTALSGFAYTSPGLANNDDLTGYALLPLE